jgi:hypothetical protein
VRRLIFNRETGSQRGVSATGKEAVKETGSETPDQKESHTLNDDEEQDYEDDNSAFNYDMTYDDDDTEIDYALYMREDYDVSRRQRISYDGDNNNIQLAYSFSRYLVELLAVSPRFQFVGELQVYDYEYCLHYYCCPKRGEHHPNVDSQVCIHVVVGNIVSCNYIQIICNFKYSVHHYGIMTVLIHGIAMVN